MEPTMSKNLKMFIAGGVAETVYNDEFRCIFEALGEWEATKATDILPEKIDGKNLFVGRDRATEKVIARSETYSACVSQEEAFIRRRQACQAQSRLRSR